MKKYNHQAIISLPNDIDNQTSTLKERISKEQSMDVSLISNIAKDNKNIGIDHLNENSRLYIFAHGTHDFVSKIFDRLEGGTEWSYQALAKFLKENLPKFFSEGEKKQGLFSKRLKISLIICYGGECNLYSFAARLQKELAEKHQIYVDINARTTMVSIDNFFKRPFTSKLGEENKLNQLNEDVKKLSSEKRYKEAEKKVYQYWLHKQPKSKIAFRLVTENKKLMQVAYDAYQLKEHENAYRELQTLANKLETYVAQRKDKPNYEDAVKAAKSLAENIKKETTIYFNKIKKPTDLTEEYKNSCINFIKLANQVLEKNRDPLAKRIAGKIGLAIGSVLIAPLLIHKALVKKEVFSQGLFSNKTAGKQITENIESVINRVKPIEEIQRISLN